MAVENVKELRVVIDIDAFKTMQQRFGVKSVRDVESELAAFLEQTFVDDQ